MAIRDWPIDERPREKLLGKGGAALSDAEFLVSLIVLFPIAVSTFGGWRPSSEGQHDN